jgi:CheY-like chemotaxis protein
MIFEEFYQAPRSPDMSREGLGLGLSIVRRIAELLGHPLEVQSKVDEGSCFSVSVPRVTSAPAIAEPLADAREAGTPRTGLVVVVDDDVAVARATAMLLETAGLEVVAVTGTAEALDELKSRDAPSLLICDYHIGSAETGVDAIAAIRKAAALEVPAILISGDTSQAMLETPKAMKRCHLLSKPVEADQLLTLVARLIDAPDSGRGGGL